MIQLHRLGHQHEPLHVNPDLIQTVEANPDCVVTLTTGHRLIVNETPVEVLRAVREWRVGLLAEALKIAA